MPPNRPSTLRLVCLSDTHNRHDQLVVPDGDVLLHAGDFSGRGTEREAAAFGAFLARLPHRAKVVVAGNHDFLLEQERERARELLGDIVYLQDSATEVAGLSLWGSPWQPEFHDWAFNLPRGPALAERWALVPAGVDVLITHGPPFGVLDRTRGGLAVGCEELLLALERIRPRLHLFGHIHEARGARARDGTLSVNASNCNVGGQLIHPPFVVDWDEDGPRIAEG